MLTIENLSKSYGDKELFKAINGTITEQDRIGLIGVNGTGKSSFLKIIAGIEAPDKGIIKHPHDYRIEYLAQEPLLDPNLTVIEQIYAGDAFIMKTMREYEQALHELQKNSRSEEAQTNLLNMQQKMDEHDAWEANTIAKTILSKLGITNYDQQVTNLSGGQAKRVALAKALIQPAELLILDEPTNHLDSQTVQWLEGYLNAYQGALLIVTHDRYFLNRVTNKIYELDHGNLYSYNGNYEFYLEKKAEREAQEVRDQERHQNTLRRELAWLRRGARARSTKQKARIERYENLQEKKFHTDQKQVDFQVGSSRLGSQVIELIDIQKTFDNYVLIDQFSRLMNRTDRIGIIGPNGTGKTTLLNIIAGRLKPDKGKVLIGETVKIGYYTQGDEELDESMRVIDYIKEVAEVIYTKDGQPITAAQMLEHFLFTRDDQWTYIRRLSGGERRRLYLLRILMTEPNVLLLDEPTNDLDTQTLSVLEEYLNDFPGVVITVSHDRYFLDRVVNELLIFTDKGKIDSFYGNYSEYLETLQQLESTIKSTSKSKKPKHEKTKQKKRLSYLEQREWESIEDEITELDEKIISVQKEIDKAGSDIDKVQKLYQEQQQLEHQLELKMNRWEELSLLVEQMKK